MHHSFFRAQGLFFRKDTADAAASAAAANVEMNAVDKVRYNVI